MRRGYQFPIWIFGLCSILFMGCAQSEQDSTQEDASNIGQSDHETQQSEYEIEQSDSLVWVIDDGQLAQRLEEPLNQLLKEKGVTYTVSIEGGSTDEYVERRDNYLAMLKERRNQDEPTDVIYIPWTQIEQNDYATAVEEGLLQPLELEEGEGSVTEILGEFAVESVKVNGVVYGLRGLPEYFNIGLAFSKYYLEKDGISEEELSGNVLENEALFEKFLQTDDEVSVPIAYWALTEEQLGYQYLFPSNAVGFSYDNGEEIVNVLAQEDTKEYLESLKKLKDHNLITFLNLEGFDTLSVQNSYFAICYYGTKPDSYEFQISDFLDKDGNQITTDVLFVPDHVDQKSLNIMPRGQITGIASWSKRSEEAYDFLKLLYTDPDVANLVKFGEEGTDYRVEQGRVVELLNDGLSPRAYVEYINDTITYPMKQEPQYKQENWENYFENFGIHPLAGFQFDSSQVQEEIEATNEILSGGVEGGYSADFKALLSGNVDNVEEALNGLNEKLEAAGISKIIEEANRQVTEWEAAVKE